MKSFRAEMALVRFLIGVGLAVGDQGGHAVEGLVTYLWGKEKVNKVW